MTSVALREPEALWEPDDNHVHPVVFPGSARRDGFLREDQVIRKGSANFKLPQEHRGVQHLRMTESKHISGRRSLCEQCN